jgi:hypothetical protein
MMLACYSFSLMDGLWRWLRMKLLEPLQA